MPANKRIPVSEEVWKKLGEMKSAGETYDQLLKKLVQVYSREQLVQKAEETRQMDAEELASIDDL